MPTKKSISSQCDQIWNRKYSNVSLRLTTLLINKIIFKKAIYPAINIILKYCYSRSTNTRENHTFIVLPAQRGTYLHLVQKSGFNDEQTGAIYVNLINTYEVHDFFYIFKTSIFALIKREAQSIFNTLCDENNSEWF